MVVLTIDSTSYWMNKTLKRYFGKQRLTVESSWTDVAMKSKCLSSMTVVVKIIKKHFKEFFKYNRKQMQKTRKVYKLRTKQTR